MTYKLPFGLTQKPVNKYFEHGVIKFNVREGKLFYTIKQITKTGSGDIRGGQVGSKTHLDKLLSIKTFNDIHTIEVVQ